MRVLVVEDEVRLANNIAVAMREGPGYAVDVANDGQAAIHLLMTEEYDLVVLDLMLPRISGDQILARLRSQDETTPVLVLTAVTGTRSTIQLLDSGADDYMTKPFDLGELISRSRALVRRGKGLRSAVLKIGDICLNSTRQIVTLSDQVLDLSPTEYRILEYLLHRPRMIVSKRELLEHLYDFTWEHHSNVVEAHISNLRRKLKAASSTVLLETYRSRGYRLTALRGEE